MIARSPIAAVLLVAPALAVLALGFAWPIGSFIAFGVRNSARATADFGGPAALWAITRNTLELGLWTTALALLVGYPVAYYLVRSPSPWRHVVLFVMFVPLMFSVVVRTFGWIVLLGSDGLVNKALLATHLIAAPVVWLYNFPATVAGLVHVLLPFMTLSIVTSLAKIDPSLEEAAAVLGAGRWRILRRVTVPLSAQGVFGGCAIVFSLSTGAYVTPKLIGGGRVQVLATETYGQMLEVGDWRSGALLGAFLTALTLAAVAIYRLSMRRGAEAG